tara:strand:+ start:743 stop:1462 length:720 start_codon:yes stop_codon:yes gene_type:complete
MTKNGRDYLIATIKSIFSKEAQKEKRRIRRRINLDRLIKVNAYLDRMQGKDEQEKIDFNPYKADNGTYKFDVKMYEVEDDFKIDLEPVDGTNGFKYTEPPKNNFTTYRLDVVGFERDTSYLSSSKKDAVDVRMSIKNIATEFVMSVQSELGQYGDVYFTKKGSGIYYSQDDEVHQISFGDDYQIIFVPEGVDWTPDVLVEDRYTKQERKAIRDFYDAQRKKGTFISTDAPRRKADAFKI